MVVASQDVSDAEAREVAGGAYPGRVERDRADALWKAPWPQPTLPGVAVLVLWLAGAFLAAGGLARLARRLRAAPLQALPSGDRALAE